MTNENLPAIPGSGLPYETAIALRRRAYAQAAPARSGYFIPHQRHARSATSPPWIIQPDPLVRRNVAWLAAVAEIGCLVFAFYVLASLNHAAALRETAPYLAASEIYQLWCVLAGCSILVAGGYAGFLTLMALLTMQSLQSPPPGIGVIWETRLRTGQEARNWAMKELCAAAVIFVVGCSFAIELMWNV